MAAPCLPKIPLWSHPYTAVSVSLVSRDWWKYQISSLVQLYLGSSNRDRHPVPPKWRPKGPHNCGVVSTLHRKCLVHLELRIGLTVPAAWGRAALEDTGRSINIKCTSTLQIKSRVYVCPRENLPYLPTLYSTLTFSAVSIRFSGPP